MKRLCFFGDALLCDGGLADSGPQPATTDPDWVGRLVRAERARGTEVMAFNLGTPNDTTLSIALRWRDEAERRLEGLAKGHTGLVFCFGSGDMADDGQGGIRVSLFESVATAERIVAEASALWPCLWIGPPPPRRLVAGDHGSWLGALTRAYAAVSDRLGVPYLDLQTAAPSPPAPSQTPDLAARVAAWSAWRRWFDPAPPAMDGLPRGLPLRPFAPTLTALG